MKKITTTLAGITAMMASTMVLTTNAHGTKTLNLPDGVPFVIAAKQSKCKLINPFPKPNEEVYFIGECVNGYANGHGIFEWFLNGKPNGISRRYIDMGFQFNNKYYKSTPATENLLLIKATNSICGIVLPIASNNQMYKNMFSARYDKPCNSKNTQITVFFNNQYFGTYTGPITRSTLPNGGTFVTFSGTQYTMGRDNGSKDVNVALLSQWLAGFTRMSSYR